MYSVLKTSNYTRVVDFALIRINRGDDRRQFTIWETQRHNRMTITKSLIDTYNKLGYYCRPNSGIGRGDGSVGWGLVEESIWSSDFMGSLISSRFVSTAGFKSVCYLTGETALLFDSERMTPLTSRSQTYLCSLPGFKHVLSRLNRSRCLIISSRSGRPTALQGLSP